MAALRIALIYFVVGILWIAFSDWLLLRWWPAGVVPAQTIKGLAFVALSSVLVLVLARRETRHRENARIDQQQFHQRLAGMERLEAIGRLTAGIAHDFNNLLTAIIGNIETYLGRLREEGVASPPELREARRAADRAAEVTRQLLAFGRQQVLHPRLVDVNRVIGDMGSLLQRLIGDRVRISLQLQEDPWPVHVDPGRLEQVIMNLAINARDAMPEGGELTLATSNVSLRDEDSVARFPFPIEPGDYVALEVIDTGVGMDAETQARIYEPFFTTKPKDVGTGLGLSTVYGIIKQSGGFIAVSSAPRAGTTFEVYLPRAPGKMPTSEPVQVEDAVEVEGTETVLVVEDDEAVRALIGRALRRRGFEVIETTGGQEALDVLRSRNPKIDLLLTDAVMPGMTGVELIEEARGLDGPFRVLLMSGYAEGTLDIDVPYIAKPFSPAELVKRVRDVLDGPAGGG